MRRLTAVLLVLGLGACEKAPPPPPPATAAAAAPVAAAPAAEVVCAATPAGAAPAVAARPSAALLHPDAAKVDVPGPDSFTVHVVTSKGPFDVKVHRDWAPLGADHLYYLMSNNYYDGVRFFRVLAGFMAQFGVAGDTAVNNVWSERAVQDDPVKHSNTRGTLTFATRGPNTRSTQLFINYGPNANLDQMGFSPLGEVTKGMAAVDSLYGGYGEGAPNGSGADQMRLGHEGNAYLLKEFPKLDYIKTARVTEECRKK